MPTEPDRRLQFEQCVNTCADSLYRVAYRLTGDSSGAAELVQETYLNAWKSLGNLREPSRMRAWLFAILRNQWKKQINKQTRRPQVSSMVAPESLPEPSQETEVRDFVQDALQHLDETFRLPLLLVTMEGLKVDEAAEILELPRGTVLSRISRGKAKLKQRLAQQLEPNDE